MSLRTYEYIAAVSKHKSFSKAADACCVTQPTLSAQIKKMEDKLGVTLFFRTTKGVELTCVGAKILDQTLAVLKIVEEIDYTAEARRIEARSSVCVGMEPGLAPFLFGHISDLSQELDPAVRLTCRENSIEMLMEDMDKRLIDIAIVAKPKEELDYKFTPILKERILLGVSRFHKLAGVGQLMPEDIPFKELVLLKGQDLASLGITTPAGDRTEVGAQNIENVLTALHFVKDQSGCVLVPGICGQQISAVRPDIRLLELDGERFSRTIGVMSHRAYPRAAWLNSLCDSIQTHGELITKVAA